MNVVLIYIVRFYQRFISAVIPFNQCKFYPSCSEYSLEAVRKHGFSKGLFLSIKRILRCNPWSSSNGYDPVP